MHIEIHGFTTTIKRLTPQQADYLCRDILHINSSRFKTSDYKGSVSKAFAFPGSKESVAIRLGTLKDSSHIAERTHTEYDNHGQRQISKYSEYQKGEQYYDFPRLTLHGSFFDNSPDFQLGSLLKFLTSLGWTPKQLDVAYTDDQQHTTLEDWRRWLGEDWKSYCTGSLFRKSPPGEKTEGGKFIRFELASASSKTNYASIYIRPDTGLIRNEIKYKDEEKIKHLLSAWDQESPVAFYKRAVAAMVSCIDIVTPSSKKTRCPDKYIRDPKWLAYVDADVTAINWTTVKTEAAANRERSDATAYVTSLKRVAAMVTNVIARNEDYRPRSEIIVDLLRLSLLS